MALTGRKVKTSQLALVSDGNSALEGRKFLQYFAALSATLGALAFGGALGWSSAAGEEGEILSAEYGVPISVDEFSWIGSILNLGCAVVCIPTGLLMDVVGRKRIMLALIVPYTVGWALIIWSKSVWMFCVGRFLLGFGGGALCVVVPVYTAEICEVNIRGRLGSYLDLMFSTGILFSYAISEFVTIYSQSMILASIPLAFFAIFSFMPESPVFHLMRNRESEARASLLRLRGPVYDVDGELQWKKDALLEEAMSRGSFLKAVKSRVARNGFIVAYGLMFFQQMSGITAIIFYTGTIFGRDGDTLSQKTSETIFAALQVLSTATSTMVVDRAGRKVLLISSISAMAIGTFTLGVYFYLIHVEVNVSEISWLPLVAVCLFVVMSSFGFGPIPWMMLGELFSPQIKGVAGSSACSFNWMMAFMVTRWYNYLVGEFGSHVTFWMFSSVSVLGVIFVASVVPETKGKSLEQIQLELAATPKQISNSVEVVKA